MFGLTFKKDRPPGVMAWWLLERDISLGKRWWAALDGHLEPPPLAGRDVSKWWFQVRLYRKRPRGDTRCGWETTFTTFATHESAATAVTTALQKLWATARALRSAAHDPRGRAECQDKLARRLIEEADSLGSLDETLASYRTLPKT